MDSRQQISTLLDKIDIYISVNRFEAAQNLLEKALKEYGETANLRNALGIVFHKQSRFDDAIKEFKKAIDINPQFIEGPLNLAVTLCDIGRYKNAESIYQIANNESNHSGKNTPRLVRGRIANLHAELGNCYEEVGKKMEAISQYRAALELLPSMNDIRSKIAKLYLDIGQLQKAEVQLEKILQSDDSHAKARNMLGLIHFKRGLHGKAKDQWLKALQSDPDNPTTQIYLTMHLDQGAGNG